MRILFIKPQRIGDTLILTSTLQAVKDSYPEAEIWVLVRRETAGILAGCPCVHKVLTLAGSNDKEINFRTVCEGIHDVWRLRRVSFDYVFELSDQHRGRLFACLTRARRRYSVRLFGKMNRWERWRFNGESSFDSTHRHRVERDFYSVAEFLPLKAATPPPMVFARNKIQDWHEGGELANFCVLQIGTWKESSRWPRERWRDVAVFLLEHFERIVISSGSRRNEIADATWLQQELGKQAASTVGRTNWPQVAGLLYRARLYVGHDTATMHLAAACGCPIVALFATTEDRWFPWKADFRAVLPPVYREISDPLSRGKLRREPKIEDITSAEVIDACGQMLVNVEAKQSL